MPPLAEVLSHLDGYGAWIAAVVAGLGALGWLLRRLFRGTRGAFRRVGELGRKIDALDDIAQRELTEGPPGENSTKDYARIAAGHALAIEKLEHVKDDHETRLQALEAWRREHGPWSDALAARLEELLTLLEQDG